MPSEIGPQRLCHQGHVFTFWKSELILRLGTFLALETTSQIREFMPKLVTSFANINIKNKKKKEKTQIFWGGQSDHP